MTIVKTKSKNLTKEILEEEKLFFSLRAQNWQEFIGQKNLRENLQIAIESAKKRQDQMEHILFYGPPGLGKTTLAHIVAREMNVNIKITSGPALTKAGDLAAILTNLNKGDILFIDEIHRLNKAVEETLYPAMEDYCLDIIIGKGPSARTVRIDLPKFTIVAATTRIGLLSAPMRDRFGVIQRLQFYSFEELAEILSGASQKIRVDVEKNALEQIAKRARGTPRIALKFLKRVRDFALVKSNGKINETLVNQALDLLEVDSMGLDDIDRKMLLAIIEKHSGGPVGLETIAAIISEDIGTVEDVIEPYLLQQGFLKRTPRGRVITEKGYLHFGKTPPQNLTQ